MVDKRNLKGNHAVKIIEEITPIFKDSVFIFIFCQLVVNIVKPYGLRVEFILHPADSVPSHFQVGDRLLGGDMLFSYRLLFLGFEVFIRSPIFFLTAFYFFWHA